MSEQELEYIGDFDPETLNEEELENEPVRYVFDPDTNDNEPEEIVEYDPAKRKRRKRPKTRTKWRTKVRRVYRKAKKKVKRRTKDPLTKISKMAGQFIVPLGLLIGIMSDPMADGRGIKGAFGFMKYRLFEQGWKLPSLHAIEWWLFDDQAPPIYKAPIFGGLALGIGMTILNKFKLNPVIGKIARPLSKLGWGLFAGGILGMILWLGGSEGTKYTKTPAEAYGNGRGNYGNTISEETAYQHILDRSPF